MDYFLLSLSVLCIAVQFAISRDYQKKYVRSFMDTLFFAFASGVAHAVLFTLLGLCFYGSLPGFSLFSLGMSLSLAIVFVLSTIVGMMVMKHGNLSVYSVFMMLGGMVLPYIYGVFSLDESVSVTKIIGLAILVIALPCTAVRPAAANGESRQAVPTVRFYVLCASIFCINGMSSILSKAHAIAVSAVMPMHFIAYVNLWQAAISGILYGVIRGTDKTIGLAERKVTPRAKMDRNRVLSRIVAFAAVSGTGYLFHIIAAETVPAVALYPFLTGGSIVLSATVARLVFKEKACKSALVGVALSLLGTLFFVF